MPGPPEGALNFRRSLSSLERGGNLSRLNGLGRGEMLALKLSRILDLWTRAEPGIDAPPFLGQAESLNLSVLPHCCRPLNEATLTGSNAEYSCALLDHGENGIVSILGAILNAPPGPLLIHGHAGKDRTGLIVALCLEIAGISREEIAADHVASGPELVDFYAALNARMTSEKWATYVSFVSTVPDDILRPLAHLDTVWSGRIWRPTVSRRRRGRRWAAG